MSFLCFSTQNNFRHVFKMSAFGTNACFESPMPLVNGCVNCVLFNAVLNVFFIICGVCTGCLCANELTINSPISAIWQFLVINRSTLLIWSAHIVSHVCYDHQHKVFFPFPRTTSTLLLVVSLSRHLDSGTHFHWAVVLLHPLTFSRTELRHSFSVCDSDIELCSWLSRNSVGHTHTNSSDVSWCKVFSVSCGWMPFLVTQVPV